MEDNRVSHVGLSMALAEDGATPEVLRATEVVVQLLNGFTNKLAQSVLMNASAMVLCHVCDTETEAVEESKRLRREIERCIRVNFASFKSNEANR